MLGQSATPQPTPDLDAPCAGEALGGAAGARGRPSLTIETGTREGATILTLKGQLVSDTLVAAEAKILTETVLSARPLKLVLDLTEVDAIDQHATNLLTKTRFAVCAARGTLHLVAPPGGAVHPALNRYLHQITVPRPEDVPGERAPGTGG